MDSRLYLILDKDYCFRGNLTGLFRQVSKETIDLVQLRQRHACDRDFLNDAKIIKRLAHAKDAIFLINNRLDIAQIIDADGLHLGQSDLPLNAARGILGKNKIIGLSCHNLTQALKAEAEGADYISIGPAFSSPLKPNLKPIDLRLIRRVSQKIKIPLFVIGGINCSNIRKVISYGAERVALCRAICGAQDPKKSARQLRKLIYDYRD